MGVDSQPTSAQLMASATRAKYDACLKNEARKGHDQAKADEGVCKMPKTESDAAAKDAELEAELIKRLGRSAGQQEFFAQKLELPNPSGDSVVTPAPARKTIPDTR